MIIKPRGVFLNVEIYEKSFLINLNILLITEFKPMGGICYTNEEFEDVLKALFDGTVPTETMITSEIPLEKTV